EEMVVAGRLDPKSAVYKLLKWGERQCLVKAGAVVSLTQAALPYLRERAGAAGGRLRFSGVPTCAGLDRFAPAEDALNSKRAIGSIGTVMSGWYRFPWLTAFFRAVERRIPGQQITIVTREDSDAIRRAAETAGVPGERLTVYGVGFAD